MHKDTIIIEAGRPRSDGPVTVNVPVQRASTVLFPSLAAYEAAAGEKYTAPRYGRHGTQTTFALQEAVAELEGGYRSIALPSGVAAISSTLTAVAKPGSHLLVCDNVFGPTRTFCETHLRPIGVDITYFASAAGAEIAELFKDNTVAVYCESPGSLTFEMQDIPAIAVIAHERGALVIHDATWATPYFFRSFERGVDISIHAATKYIVGHSDVMMGIVVCSEQTWKIVRPVVASFGFSTSADDAYLALRGLRTLAVRLERHQSSALKVANFLESHDRVEHVLYPALPSDPGNAIWRRDFTGASGLLGCRIRASESDVRTMIDNLRLFGIGSSWGGYESLATPQNPRRTFATPEANGVLIRIHVGLENPDDLLEDLERGLSSLSAENYTAPAARSVNGSTKGF